MNKMSVIIAFIALLIAVCHAELPKFPTRLQSLQQFKANNTGKIVGGEAVGDCVEYPYQVSIQRKASITGQYNHFCGGSVISPDYILTAGHCVSGRKASGISILVGTHKLDPSGKNGIRRAASDIIVHEDYKSRDIDYDIALIKLEKSLDLSHECVTAAKLPSQNKDLPPGSACFATGWGTTSEGGSVTSTLRAVDVPLVSQADCKESYGQSDITPRMVCAGLKDGGKDACQGDSGGPLNCEGVLTGITSWGYGCARPDYYGVYTRISFFIDWIEENMD